jgi:hypothetical protein
MSAVTGVNEAGPKPYLIPLAYADYFTAYRSQSKDDYKSIFENMLPQEWVDLYWDGYKDAVRSAVPIDATRESAFASEVLGRPSRDPEPVWLVEGRDFTRLPLGCGRLVAAPNTRSQLFALAMRWDLGTRQRPLLGYALELLQQSGAGPLAAEALQRRHVDSDYC